MYHPTYSIQYHSKYIRRKIQYDSVTISENKKHKEKSPTYTHQEKQRNTKFLTHHRKTYKQTKTNMVKYIPGGDIPTRFIKC